MNSENIAPPGAPPTSEASPAIDPVTARVEQAIASGIELSAADIASIRENFAQADELNRRAGGIMRLSSDPMRKGDAFPLGVGFTRMNRSAEKRLDASVRRASEAVTLSRRAQTHLTRAEEMLAGRNTEAHHRKVSAAKEQVRAFVVDRLLTWKKGDVFRDFTIRRVNKDREDYPSSYTFEGPGIIQGYNDKVDVVREHFDGNRAAFRALVDEARAARAT